MRLTDTHCHLYFNHYNEDLASVLDRAWETGVEKIIVPGIDIQTSKSAIRLAEKNERIYAAIGIHPNSAVSWNKDSHSAIEQMSSHPKVVAIGEIGLDYYRNAETRDLQKTILHEQLDIASRIQKPVILHNRQASDDLFPILLDWHKNQKTAHGRTMKNPGVLHSVSGFHPLFASLLSLNFFFGIGGPITFKNSRLLAEAVDYLPLDQILVETDSPFLAPHPHRGQRNEPAFVKLVVNRIAEIKSTSPDEVAEKTCENAARLFFGENAIE